MRDSIPIYRDKEKNKRRPNRLALVFIVLFFLSLLVLLFFQSPLSKISTIDISGNRTLKDADVLKQASLKKGSQFFSWDPQAAKKQLMQNVQVKDVKITKRFPGKVTIKFEEWPRVAFWLKKDKDGNAQLRPVLANGVIVDKQWKGTVDRPLLRGWSDESAVAKLSKQLERVERVTLRSLSEVHPQPSDIYKDQVRVYTDDGYEVITRLSTFHENMNQYRNYVDPDKKGIVHMTYGRNFGWFEPYEEIEAIE